MRIRADENVSHKIVRAIALVCLRPGWELSHVRDDHAARTPDETWLPKFAAEGGAAILSGDANMLKRPHQLAAVKQSGLICLILSSHWTHAKRHEQAANIIYWWPRIEGAIETSAPGDCWPIPHTFDKSELQKKFIDFEKATKSIRTSE